MQPYISNFVNATMTLVFAFVYEKAFPFHGALILQLIIETPIPSLHCVRQNGYFGHEETNVCDKFYYCVDGMFNMITCPAGLVFNPKTGICTWPDEAHKLGCSSEGEWFTML